MQSSHPRDILEGFLGETDLMKNSKISPAAYGYAKSKQITITGPFYLSLLFKLLEISLKKILFNQKIHFFVENLAPVQYLGSLWNS